MKTSTLRTAIRDLLYRGGSFVAPTQWWLQVYASDPGPGLNGAAPLFTNRIPIAGWQNNGDNACSNSSVITINNNTGSTITLAYFSIHDAQTGGRSLNYGRFIPTFVLNNNESFSIPPGSLTITFR